MPLTGLATMPQLIYSGFQGVSKNIQIYVILLNKYHLRTNNVYFTHDLWKSMLLIGRPQHSSRLNTQIPSPPQLITCLFQFFTFNSILFLIQGLRFFLVFSYYSRKFKFLQFFASFKHFLAADLDSGANPPNPRLSLWS